MTNQIKNFIQEGENEFHSKFVEFASDGSSYGAGLRIIHAGTIDDREILDNIKQFISSRQISLIKMIVERMKQEIWAYHTLDGEWLKKYNVSEELEKELNEMFMNAHNNGLEPIIRHLSNLRDEL